MITAHLRRVFSSRRLRDHDRRRFAPSFVFAALVSAVLVSPSLADDGSSTVTVLPRLPRTAPGFLVPTDPSLLFFIHLSTTPKTVVYVARTNGPGQLNREQPVDVFWRRSNAEAGRSSLSLLERKLAYGVDILHNADGATFAEIAAYPQRKLMIDTDRQGRPEAVIQMGTHRAKLIYVSVQIVSSGVVPSVAYADVYGVDQSDRRILHEHFIPR